MIAVEVWYTLPFSSLVATLKSETQLVLELARPERILVMNLPIYKFARCGRGRIGLAAWELRSKRYAKPIRQTQTTENRVAVCRPGRINE